MSRHNLEDWLVEQDIPAGGGQPDPAGGQAPTSDPMGPGAGDPSITNMTQDMGGDPNQQDPNQPEDLSDDPQAPDMPEPHEKPDDFEVWKNQFMKESIKGDTQSVLSLLSQVKSNPDLQPYQKKFVDDNWNIYKLRENANIDRASKEIRKLIKGQLDRNNPSTSLMNHISATLESDVMLASRFHVISGYNSAKSDLHRKYLAALLGAFQVGSGSDSEDIIYNQMDYSIMISTRFNAKWGEVVIGTWSLREDDPERYLSQPELKRLTDGSPEERDVLRRRVVMESIANQYEQRSFLIHVTGDDGTVFGLGWDLSNFLRAGYTEGKLVVRSRHSENSEAMIDDEGNIVPLVDLSIFYEKETGQQTEDGMPEKKEIEFMERRNGSLFLTAGVDTIREASSAMQGMSFKEVPWNGNPSDLEALKKCVFSTHDMIMRQCP